MTKRRRTGSQPFSLFAFQDIITSVTGIMILVTLVMALELLDRVETSPAAQTERITGKNETSIEDLKREIESLQEKASKSQEAFADLSTLPSLSLEHLQGANDTLSEELRALHREVNRSEASLATKQLQLSNDSAASEKHMQQMQEQLEKLERLLADTQQKAEDVGESNRIYYKAGVNGKTTWLVEITAGGWMAAPIGVEARPVEFASYAALTKWLTARDSRSEAFFLTTKPGGVTNFSMMRIALTASGFDVGFQVLGQDQIVLDAATGASLP